MNHLIQSPTLPVKPAELNQRVLELFFRVKGKHSPHTLRAYRQHIFRFLSFIENKPLQTVTAQDLQAFAESIDDKLQSTQNAIMAAVKSLFTFANKIMPEFFPANVSAVLTANKLPDNLTERILTTSQVHQLIKAAASNLRNLALITFLYATGARREEVVSVCWRDITPRKVKDETGQTINVAQVSLLGKGNKRRQVLIVPNVYKLLLRYKPVNSEANDRIFDIGGDRIYQIVTETAEKCGLKISPHWLRHAFASHVLDSGASLQETASAMGHNSINTTNRYAHAKLKGGAGLLIKL